MASKAKAAANPKPAAKPASEKAKAKAEAAPVKQAKAAVASKPALDPAQAGARLAVTGRNEPCPCGSGSKYKKCHLRDDEAAAAPVPVAPDAKGLVAEGWRLFEQRRPGAAEKQFRAALDADPDSADAQVGVGMAKLSAGDTDAAKTEFEAVIAKSGKLAADLEAKGKKDGKKDAFTLPEAQAYIRAAHALGCLAYDKDEPEAATAALAKVYAIDEGAVGTEARLVAGKAFMKLKRPADAISVLEPAAGAEAGEGEKVGKVRAFMGLALAHFTAGDRAKAEKELTRALAENPYFGKAVLGLVRVRVDNPAAATPGSREEAALYAQSFGDVWDEPAKEFLRTALEKNTSPPTKGTAEGAGAASHTESEA